jgi:hypothetical protein
MKNTTFYLLLVTCLIVSKVHAQTYSGGSGTQADPYLISTKSDLKYLSEHNSEWSKYFSQVSDIVFNGTDFQTNGAFYNNGSGFRSIGNDAQRFMGSYNGNLHTIDGLYINNLLPSDIGFFGYIGTGSLVNKVQMTNANITGMANVGALVGTNNGGAIDSCYSSGTISGGTSIGGLVGSHNYGTVRVCHSSATVLGDQSVGGLIGYDDDGITSDSYANGSVTGNGYVGGLIGHLFTGTTVKNYSTCEVTGSAHVGGLIGFVGSTAYFYSNYWDVMTSGQSTSAGGGVGKTTQEMQTQATYTSWDFTNIWRMNCASGYPEFQWHPNTYSALVNVTSSCDYYWSLNGQTYSVSGQYQDTTNNSNGCDTITTLNLTIVSSYPIQVENVFVMPSGDNPCDGGAFFTLTGNADFELDMDNGSQLLTSSGNSQINGLCGGIHDLHITDHCGDTLSIPVVIPIDSNYVFNNPYTDSIPTDSLGFTLEDCEIDFGSIDTAYIDSIWSTGNTVNVIWNIVDSNGSNFDTTTYILNNGNGVYWLQLSVYCPFKSVGEYFTVTEAIYFQDGHVGTAGLTDYEKNLFEIYPNPTNNQVHINFSSSEAELTVYDLQGKIVLKDQIQNQGIVSLQNFEKGVYLFDFKNSQGRSVQRVVKQ